MKITSRRRPASAARRRRSLLRVSLAAVVGGLTLLALGSPASALPVPGVDPIPTPPKVAPPAVPQLSVYFPSPGSEIATYGSAPLMINNIKPGAGQLASVKVLYSGRSFSVPLTGVSNGSVEVRIPDLVDGTAYTFRAMVCNTANRCAQSNAVTFTPYGMPTAPQLNSSVTGTRIDVRWGTVTRNASPWDLACTVEVRDNASRDLLYSTTVDPDRAGSSVFFGQHGKTYVGGYVCIMARGYQPISSSTPPLTVV